MKIFTRAVNHKHTIFAILNPGPIVHLSLMEPMLDNKAKPDGAVFGTDDEEELKAVELLKVELVLNVPPVEDGGKL